MNEGVTEGLNGSWNLSVVGNEKKDFIRVYPACGDKCVEKIGDCGKG